MKCFTIFDFLTLGIDILVMHKGELTWIHYWLLKDYGRLSRMHIPWTCHSEAYVLKLLATVIFLEYARLV